MSPRCALCKFHARLARPERPKTTTERRSASRPRIIIIEDHELPFLSDRWHDLPHQRYCNRVPGIIEYPIALQHLQNRGLVCNYFNGGAFGFSRNIDLHVLGWIANDDPTIRP